MNEKRETTDRNDEAAALTSGKAAAPLLLTADCDADIAPAHCRDMELFFQEAQTA